MNCDDKSLHTHQKERDEECFLINEMLFNDWARFYEESTAMLNSKNQSSSCDCYRSNVQFPENVFENRYTKRQTPFGEIELIYLQSMVNKIRIDGKFPPYSSYENPERCQPGECSPSVRENAFEGDLNSTLHHVLPKMCPDKGECHAFVNLGWDNVFNFSSQSEFSCVIEEYEQQHPQIKLYLITSPEDKTSPKSMVSSRFNTSKLKCKVKVLDRYTPSKNVPQEWYWNSRHVYSILNEEYNHQLMRTVCPISPIGDELADELADE